MKTLDQFDLSGKRVLIRADLNVPIADGRVTSEARIQASLPTMRQALDAGAAVMVMSHLGRPTEGEPSDEFSLKPVAEKLTELLGQPVDLVTDWIDGVDVEPGQLVLLENVRFLKGEKANDDELAKKMAALCDIFCMDAFATAHRAQASTEGVIRHSKSACAGPLLAAEVNALDKALADPARPMVAIVGGAKVSGKLQVLEALIEKVDQLIVGGGIANTFLAAAGHRIGKSLHEPDLVDTAKALMKKAEEKGAAIPLPTDLMTAERFHQEAHASLRDVSKIHADEMILDIGPETAGHLAEIIKGAGTVIWNGPVGVFEFDAFSGGTKAIAHAVASCSGFTLAGGGDTIAAIEKFGVAGKVDYISTAGGAFLEYVEGKELPALVALRS
ncbi:phosphoglycerate kinase [Wenzhouxiangella sp. XN79A]|uniref:phosphoglycerate kinase n=1 Tax=Wenzhouxiangella sp. XN79A TaxID=2724193 RepID=UPI00144A8FCA|nr:phosphoglycerate kinase [Wenzhouxiangella sp. XN79A]NKI36456.1 phosphoglycerate kinase [Wenzhouxiangella sp. XN79A]